MQVRIRGKVNGEPIAHSFEVTLRNQGGDPSTIIRSGQWKLIHYHEDRHDELYDLGADPGHPTPIAGALVPAAIRITVGREKGRPKLNHGVVQHLIDLHIAADGQACLEQVRQVCCPAILRRPNRCCSGVRYQAR